MKEVNNEKYLIDEHDGIHEMKEVNNEKYVGDILSNDEKNPKNSDFIRIEIFPYELIFWIID